MTLRIFAAALLLSCTAVFAADWTVFNGLTRDNISPETGLLQKWEAPPELLWKADFIGNTEFPGYSGVTIADGKIYTSGNVKVGNSDQTADAFVFCLDEKTGKEIWRYKNGSGWTAPHAKKMAIDFPSVYPGERSTPTIDGDRVYACSAVGRLACLNAKTGKEIWARNLQEEYAAQVPTWAYAESVVIDGTRVIFWVGGTKAAVVAMNKMTGETVWETPSTNQKANYASMTMFDLGGLRIFANMNQKGLLLVHAETGEQLLSFPHETPHDILATTPYYFDGKLLISSGGGKGTKLLKLNVNAKEKKVTAEELWAQPKFDNFHGGIIVKEGYAYGSSHKYKLDMWLCINLKDGSIVWEKRGIGMGAMSYADGMLYCMAEKDGEVALVKASPEKYEETGKFTLPEEGAGMYWAHPVICGGKLYLRHANFLYCYDVKKK